MSSRDAAESSHTVSVSRKGYCCWGSFHFRSLTSQIHFSFMVWPEAPTPNGPESQSAMEEDAAEKDEEGSEDEWEQVGPRNKTSITRQADFVRTPITDIFGGHIRYVDKWIFLSPKELSYDFWTYLFFFLSFFWLCSYSIKLLNTSVIILLPLWDWISARPDCALVSP